MRNTEFCVSLDEFLSRWEYDSVFSMLIEFFKSRKYFCIFCLNLKAENPVDHVDRHIYIQKDNSYKYKYSPLYRDRYLLNTLFLHIKGASTLNTFKRLLKDYLFKECVKCCFCRHLLLTFLKYLCFVITLIL